VSDHNESFRARKQMRDMSCSFTELACGVFLSARVEMTHAELAAMIADGLTVLADLNGCAGTDEPHDYNARRLSAVFEAISKECAQ